MAFSLILTFALMFLGAVVTVIAFSPPVQAKGWVGRIFILGISLILVTIPLNHIFES